MNKDLHNLKNEAYKIRMTPAEKASMRAQLFGATSPADFQPRRFGRGADFFTSAFMGRAFAGVLALLVVLGSGGTAFAAEGSLPGDFLYTMKVNVNEPIKTALAVGPEARADVHLELAQRRVEEAETLAAAGKLDATTTAQLEANFETHAQDADELALEVGHEDPSAAVEIQTKLSSSLSVHGAILAALGDDSKDVKNKDNSNGFAVRVLARANETTNTDESRATLAVATKKTSTKGTPQNQSTEPTPATFAVTAAQTATTNVATDTATDTNATIVGGASTSAKSKAEIRKENAALRTATQTQKRATSSLSDALDAYQNIQASMNATARADVDNQFTSADKSMQDGAAALAAGTGVEANTDFTAALKLAVKLKAVLAAQKKFKRDFTPLLNGGTSIESSTTVDVSSTSQETEDKNTSKQEDDSTSSGSDQQDNQDHGIIKNILKAL